MLLTWIPLHGGGAMSGLPPECGSVSARFGVTGLLCLSDDIVRGGRAKVLELELAAVFVDDIPVIFVAKVLI